MLGFSSPRPPVSLSKLKRHNRYRKKYLDRNETMTWSGVPEDHHPSSLSLSLSLSPNKNTSL